MTPPSSASFHEEVATLYAAQDAAALERTCRRASNTEQVLLCRYRLYPLTQNEMFLGNLPAVSATPSAREYALLSAVWAMRAAQAPVWQLPRFGRRSEDLLQQARQLDPLDPYVLLVEGQSYYYKPAIFGGSAQRALQSFTQLRTEISRHRGTGISNWEADVWVWMATRRVDRQAADEMRERLLAQHPPPLFRQFLLDPPR